MLQQNDINLIKNSYQKWSSLVMLILQNVSWVLVMRFVRTRPGYMFSSSSAVVCAEVVKLIVSTLIIFHNQSFKLTSFYNDFKDNIFGDCRDWMLISVPAVLYVIQNNLVFVAISYLDAVTFQVCYQLKLLTTAVCFRIMLNKPQSYLQWCSLFSLFVGIVIVQLDQQIKPNKHQITNSHHYNYLLGMVVVIIASCISGFGGVYYEKVLKGTPISLWIRNVQLSVYGIIFGLITVLFLERKAIFQNGFFFGYDGMVWAVILIQSIGGLLVSMVIKYADNILKGFSTSLATVLAALLSGFMFDFHASWYFVLGTSLVIISTVTYGYYSLTVVDYENNSNSSDVEGNLSIKNVNTVNPR